jgi:hypothetical protein
MAERCSTPSFAEGILESMLHLEKMRWRPQEKGWLGAPLLASGMVTMMVVAVVMVLVRREYRTGKRHQ